MDVAVRIDNTKDDGKHNNKIVICNHSGFLDAGVIMSYHVQRFPNHKLVWVAKSDVSKIPMVGKHFLLEHILLYRDIQKDLSVIHNYKHNLKNSKTPYVIYLFPEGTTRCVATMKRSRENSITQWNNLLLPKCGALYELLPLVDGVMSLTLLYDGVGTGEYHKPMFIGEYPSSVVIHVADVSQNFVPTLTFPELKSALYLEWDKKDEILAQHPSRLTRFKEHKCPRDNFEKFMIRLLGMHSLFTIWFLDWKAFLLTTSATMMACEYYYWQRHRFLNAFVEFIYISYFAYISGEASNWVLMIGFVSVLVGRITSIPFLNMYGRMLCYMAPLLVFMEK